jgi:hypothetical protein
MNRTWRASAWRRRENRLKKRQPDLTGCGLTTPGVAAAACAETAVIPTTAFTLTPVAPRTARHLTNFRIKVSDTIVAKT